MAGILSAQARTERGISLPVVQIADMSAALHAALGIVGALFAQQRHGKGRILDISLTESALALFSPMIVGILAENRQARPGREPLSGGMDHYGTFCCSDGRWIAVGAVEQKFQQKIRDVTGSIKYQDLKKFFAQRTTQECLELFGDACVSPILDILELPTNQQHQYRRVFEGNLLRNPLGHRDSLGDIPSCGFHSKMILLDCGFTALEIENLIQDGCIRISDD